MAKTEVGELFWLVLEKQAHEIGFANRFARSFFFNDFSSNL